MYEIENVSKRATLMLSTKFLPLCGIALFLCVNIHHVAAQEQKLRVTSILAEPYLMKGDDGDEDKLIGFCEDLAEKISNIIDAEHEIQLVKDGRYGTPDPSNPSGWNGMIGELLNNEADLAIAPFTITAGRAKVVDFSTPFQEFQLSILMKEPSQEEDESDSTYTFLYPFHTYVWLSVILALIIIWLISLVIESSYKKPENKPIGIINFLRQESIASPESLAGKLVRVIFWTFIFIILAAYAASFAAQRIADSEEFFTSEIDSVEDLVKASDEIHYGVIDGGSTEQYFMRSNNPLYKQMYEFMNSKNSSVANYKEGVAKVRGGDDDDNDEDGDGVDDDDDDSSEGSGDDDVEFAFILESPAAEYLLSKEPCNLIVASEDFGPTKGYGIATAKDSPWSDRVNLAVLEMKENGELEELIEKWWNEGACSGDDDEGDDDDDGDADEDDFDQLNMSELAGVFYFLIAALAIAVVAWLLETRNQK
ncbi:unnamed protein product [Orchesella dallaii]|uniref:Uncharacterized protein n=1 Tax=Orchesella dallaii TaxID=48710 RepID=A0ABP1Q247_9HEXA